MRVDLVITELHVGGAERCLTELACGLVERDHAVRVFSLAPLPRGEQRQFVDRLLARGVSLSSGEAQRTRQTLSCYRRLKAWLREGKSDVCQTFLHHANVLGTFAARATGPRLCVGGIRVAQRHWLRCRIEAVAAARMDRVVCVSGEVAEFAQSCLHLPESRCRVIGNGIDASQFADVKPADWNELGWPAQSQVSLFVGRLHPQKGIELLQQQIDRIAPRGTDRRLLLVGDGPLRAALQRWASEVGQDRVQLIGWQPHVAPLMRASCLLVLPSHYEGMPNVILEAFASGLPVVASRVEGSRELLMQSRELQSFERGDGETMAALIDRFASDEALRVEVGRANRDLVAREFSIGAMVDAYASLYRELCARRSEVR